MDKKEFLNFVAEGYQHIPVSKTLESFNIDPINVYEKISDKSYSYLLESIEGGKKWSRYTIIGLPSQDYIELIEGRLYLHESGKTTEINTDSPVEWIQNYNEDLKVHCADNLPEFQGGLVGYFGFDTVKLFEPNIQISSQRDLLKTPDIKLIISRDLLIFDKLKNKIHIIVISDSSLDDFDKSLSKIDEIIKSIENHALSSKENAIEHRTRELSKDDKLTYHFPREKFIKSVGVAKKYITNGDVMQVVLSQRISIDFKECPIEFYRELRKLDPSPYMYYLNFGDFHIIGSSPEILVRLENDTITVRPIAGTRPRGKTEADDTKLEKDLLNDPKEIAEHLMLIDLGRNDVGRVSEIGSVRLTDKMIIEKYSHVMHMVSNVTGKVLKTVGIIDVLKASFPAGTVSGAPKIRATEIIYELEPLKRGIYAGAIGYLGWNGNMDTAIAIRTCVIKDNKLNIQCGAGIVYDSVPELEWEETINKGKAIIQAYNNTRNRQK